MRFTIFLSLLPLVAAHGLLEQITIAGKPYAGPPSGDSGNSPPSVIRQIRNNSPVDGGAQAVNNLFMSCGNDAKPAALEADAMPGDLVEFKWSSSVSLLTLNASHFERDSDGWLVLNMLVASPGWSHDNLHGILRPIMHHIRLLPRILVQNLPGRLQIPWHFLRRMGPSRHPRRPPSVYPPAPNASPRLLPHPTRNHRLTQHPRRILPHVRSTQSWGEWYRCPCSRGDG
jgi:hypothetical protein